MSEMNCPWCETELELAPEPVEDQQCPECLTSWRFELQEEELALAA